MLSLLVLRIVTIAVAGIVVYYIYKQVSSENTKPEHQLLKEAARLAENNGGIISITEFSFNSDIPLAKAEELLNKLIEKGAATVEVTENDQLVYAILKPDRIKTLDLETPADITSKREYRELG